MAVAAANLIDELMRSLGECLTPEVARRIAALQASPEVDARVRELGEKCEEGRLTTDERQEYEAIVHCSSFVSILQSKARTMLTEFDSNGH